MKRLFLRSRHVRSTLRFCVERAGRCLRAPSRTFSVICLIVAWHAIACKRVERPVWAAV